MPPRVAHFSRARSAVVRIAEREEEDAVWSNPDGRWDPGEKGQHMIRQVLMRKIASDSLVARLGQAVSFGGACLIPVLVFRRFADVELSEGHLLIGVLTTMSTALVCAVTGALLEPKSKAS